MKRIKEKHEDRFMKLLQCSVLAVLSCIVCIEGIYLHKNLEEKQVLEAAMIETADQSTSQVAENETTETQADAVEEKQEIPSVVRVLLLSADGDEYWESGSLNAGSVTKTFAEYFSDDADKMIIAPEDVQTGIRLVNESGSQTAAYRGTMELYQTEQGYVLINEVAIEEYLYSVLPSEMPESFGLEAYKAQAVCARSYIYKQLEQPAEELFGANVDDSVNYQVYHAQAETPLAIQAVDETAGRVLLYDNEVIDAYYFSTSWGMTSDMSVWKKNVGEYPYLSPTAVSENEVIDYSNEEVFRSAITDGSRPDVEAECKYYRWSGSIDENKQLDQTIALIQQRKEKVPDAIKYKNREKGVKLDTAEKFGKIVNIVMLQRNSSGAVTDCKLQFEHVDVIIEGEYNIRLILGTMLKQLAFHDGSTSDQLTILPSAYFYIDAGKEIGNTSIYGGGYGHGVGMSQYAAAILANRGMGFEEILHYFYKDVTIDSKE